jgi:hypothetical protein
MASSDRLSQLQDHVNYLASLFCDATGVLQSTVKPSKFENFAEQIDRGYDQNQPLDPNQQQQQQQQSGQEGEQDMKKTFSELITNTAKQIDELIDSLPDDEDGNIALQAEQMRQLEYENMVATRQLEHVTQCAELLLQQIQDKLSRITESELSNQRVEKD